MGQHTSWACAFFALSTTSHRPTYSGRRLRCTPRSSSSVSSRLWSARFGSYLRLRNLSEAHRNDSGRGSWHRHAHDISIDSKQELESEMKGILANVFQYKQFNWITHNQVKTLSTVQVVATQHEHSSRGVKCYICSSKKSNVGKLWSLWLDIWPQ